MNGVHPTEGDQVARAEELTKAYGEGEARVLALRGVNATFHRGGFTAVMGPSGSGKSTLLHCLAGLDRPTSGRVHLGDVELGALGDRALTRLRRERLGFVFQQFNLLPTLTARENILLPCGLARTEPDPDWLARLVGLLGLTGRLDHRPAQLSGGQQQRVACARALVTRPEVVFADEPTGNLDSHASADLLRFLRRSADELGQTVVMVTHDPSAAAWADRALFLVDGRRRHTVQDPTPAEVLRVMRELSAVPEAA
ncbi:ABC transporter ATP-binding protein [Streptomyces sp. NPDC005438]|uniref:ABC transporter ATP-binding protein n=1 Tax=Streptomyces sp. NPDC005438 TaxID=3156880 RepID=UPI0033B3F63C